MKYTTDEFDQRILYEYLAEASVVFPKVFPVVQVSPPAFNFCICLEVKCFIKVLGKYHPVVFTDCGEGNMR